MMCDPCFMDANQVGFVHELSWEDIKTMLDNALRIKPHRRCRCSFRAASRPVAVLPGRGPLLRRDGYKSTQAATNGIEFAKSKEFCEKAAAAGLRYAICSLTASATPPIRTAPWATCST